MIDKNTYRQAQIAVLSGIAKYKEGTNEIVNYNGNSPYATIELLNDERIIQRFYNYYGKVWWIVEYKNGIRDGIDIEHDENGKIKNVGSYKNGQRHGKRTTYYENGNVEWKDIYENGKLNGNSYFYTTDGILERTLVYKNGKIVEVKYSGEKQNDKNKENYARNRSNRICRVRQL